jgi:hypothetical protein
VVVANVESATVWLERQHSAAGPTPSSAAELSAALAGLRGAAQG